MRMPTLPTFILTLLEVLAREIRQEKEIKEIQIGKEEVNCYICRLHGFIKTLRTVRTNKFGEVVGYKLNIQKFLVFLYTNKELSEKSGKQSHLQL